MRCPRCGCLDDKVMETRVPKDGEVIRRRRECLACQFRFTTRESVVPAEFIVVKRDGTREDFNPEKLRAGIRRACWKRSVSEEQLDAMVATVLRDMLNHDSREVSSRDIGERAMEELQKVDEVAYVRFASVYRSFCTVDEFVSEVKNLSEQQAAAEPAARPTAP
ncbi:MAG: transcriptional repressor NrdR [Lentisphaeria bacterium]|nr:transcriptional repressor NrdR [Lentisphaeria bacterium]